MKDLSEKLLAQIESIRKNELEKLVLDDQDLMRILKVSKRTLANYRSGGYISFSKVNGRIYYTWEDVQEFLEKHKVKSHRHERV